MLVEMDVFDCMLDDLVCLDVKREYPLVACIWSLLRGCCGGVEVAVPVRRPEARVEVVSLADVHPCIASFGWLTAAITPARASEATISNMADRLLGVHGLVLQRFNPT